jgi:hypothetical protein
VSKFKVKKSRSSGQGRLFVVERSFVEGRGHQVKVESSRSERSGHEFTSDFFFAFSLVSRSFLARFRSGHVRRVQRRVAHASIDTASTPHTQSVKEFKEYVDSDLAHLTSSAERVVVDFRFSRLIL